MSTRVTKFGVEVLGRIPPKVVVDPAANTLFPLVSESNWRGTFSVETVWQTAISRSQTTGAEEREGRVSRPTRILSTLISGMSRKETARMLANAASMSGSRFPAPIYSDFSVTTNSSKNDILCDTRWRRFFAGQRVAIVPQDYSLLSGNVQAQFGIIDYLTQDGFHLVDDLATSCQIGDFVFPMIDCELSLSQEMTALTDSVAEWTQSCQEYSSSSTLPGLSQGDEVSYLGMSYYKGLPIFNLVPNWRDNIRVSVNRDGDSQASGNSNIVTPDGQAGYLSFDASFEEYDRRAVWTAARFFDSRRGRLYPFWAPNPLILFDYVSNDDSNTIYVETPASADQLAQFVSAVQVTYLDGSTALTSVSTIEDSDQYIKLTLEDAVSADDIDEITSAHICRFDHDNLKQVWTTDEVCGYDLRYRSIEDESVYGVST